MPLRALPAALALLAFLAVTAAAQERDSAPSPARDFQVAGWREAVVSVSDMAPHLKFFRKVAGWKVLAKGAIGPEQLRHWGLPAEAKGRQVLLGNPGTDTGFVRLVRFDGVQQRQVRHNTRSWDSGGLFDINVRVADMERTHRKLTRMGWESIGGPLQFSFGPFVVKEWIVRGPDGLTFALIERLQPKLEGWPHLKKFSRTFNSTQIVRDFDASRRFFAQVLGFSTYLEHKGASDPPGDNVLGLPRDMAMRHARVIEILHPQGVNEGSVELLAYEGLQGRDTSALAVPPNLGLLMLRFPTRNLPGLVRRLREHGVRPENRVRQLQLPPYGQVRIVSVRDPGGSWLEFFEELKGDQAQSR